jgi:hypothetical protein
MSDNKDHDEVNGAGRLPPMYAVVDMSKDRFEYFALHRSKAQAEATAKKILLDAACGKKELVIFEAQCMYRRAAAEIVLERNQYFAAKNR